MERYHVVYYKMVEGRNLFEEWFTTLRDVRAQAKIDTAIARVRLGNFGDHKSVGSGVQELRIHYGPGYRVYFAQHGKDVVVLLHGSVKKNQHIAIQEAQVRWLDWKERHR